MSWLSNIQTTEEQVIECLVNKSASCSIRVPACGLITIVWILAGSQSFCHVRTTIMHRILHTRQFPISNDPIYENTVTILYNRNRLSFRNYSLTKYLQFTARQVSSFTPWRQFLSMNFICWQDGNTCTHYSVSLTTGVVNKWKAP